MSLPIASDRREVHRRVVDMTVFARDDGLYDVDASLVDRKPFDYWRIGQATATPAGAPLHDLHIRLTVDASFVVRDVRAASDVTPFPLCKEAERTLACLIGERVGPGWTTRVKTLLRGVASCTHLVEMLVTLATPLLQGVNGSERGQRIEPGDVNVVPKLDSCFAYGRHRDVVRMYWPQHYEDPGGKTSKA